jgi:hypothetical protein
MPGGGSVDFAWIALVDVHTLDIRETLIGKPIDSPDDPSGGAGPVSKLEIEERAQRVAAGFLEIHREDPLRVLAEAQTTYASDATLEPLSGATGQNPKIEFAAFDRVAGRIALGVLGPARRHLVVGETSISRSVSGSLAELRPLVRTSEGGA